MVKRSSVWIRKSSWDTLPLQVFVGHSPASWESWLVVPFLYSFFSIIDWFSLRGCLLVLYCIVFVHPDESEVLVASRQQGMRPTFTNIMSNMGANTTRLVTYYTWAGQMAQLLFAPTIESRRKTWRRDCKTENLQFEFIINNKYSE